MNLIPFRKKETPDLKNRILKNREAVLDVMAENIKGARTCPYLMGQKCVGEFCEFFLRFYNADENGGKREFWRCAIVQTPLLIIELNQTMRLLISALQKSVEGKNETV